MHASPPQFLEQAAAPELRILPSRRRRILIVTPEISGLPSDMDAAGHTICAKSGGLGDVVGALVSSLFEKGFEVHVAMPFYRKIFGAEQSPLDLRSERVHLCNDRTFFYRETVYTNDPHENVRGAIAFQRDVINNVIPNVRPDLIHCHDWTTGLIPAAARRLGIPAAFTVHNLHGGRAALRGIEEMGIDAAAFWDLLYFDRAPIDYHQARADNLVDLLTSGIFAADIVNTVSPGFLRELKGGMHPHLNSTARDEIAFKEAAGQAIGILNAPGADLDPRDDRALVTNYSASSVLGAKAINKKAFQKIMGLAEDPESALFLWPNRLDPVQKGCYLLEQLLPWIHWHNHKCPGTRRIQIAAVADGASKDNMTRSAASGIEQGDVSIVKFDEALSRLGYAGSDFTLMPSSYEPCGLPQMICQKYGSLPVVFRTGGLADTVTPLDVSAGDGNGFVFEHHTASGLLWAMSEALGFRDLPADVRSNHLGRIMTTAANTFSQSRVADKYVGMYEALLSSRVQ